MREARLKRKDGLTVCRNAPDFAPWRHWWVATWRGDPPAWWFTCQWCGSVWRRCREGDSIGRKKAEEPKEPA